jgi:filamentous hemagglutinin family protein
MLIRSICAAVLLIAGPVLANPTGPAVVSGSATFNTTGNTLTVTNANGTIINWQGFSIAASETTRFQQPSSSSTVLNRVVGPSGSDIHGALTSNGKVFLVNPNGVLFGPGAQVNVAGLVVTTLDIANADFLAGNYSFAGSSGGILISQGSISASSDGSISLFAPNVTIGGTISAGHIGVATANQVDLAGAGTVGTLTVVQGSLNPVVIESNIVLHATGSVTIQSGPTVPNGRLSPIPPAVPDLGGAIGIVSAGSFASVPPALEGRVARAGMALNLQKREVGF